MSSARERQGGRAGGRGGGGGGRGRGRGDPNEKSTGGRTANQSQGKYGVPASTVDEEMRIRFTSQLHQLRESQVSEVIFPSTLNNVVRLIPQRQRPTTVPASHLCLSFSLRKENSYIKYRKSLA
jgi:hypothetical protein